MKRATSFTRLTGKCANGLLTTLAMAATVFWARSYWRIDAIGYNSRPVFYDCKYRVSASSIMGRVHVSWTEESVEPVEFRSRLADPSRVSPVGGFATVQRVRWPWARMARWQDFRFFGLLAFDGAWEVTREPSLGRAEAGGSRQLPVTLSRWRRFVVVPHWALIVVLGAWPALRWRRRRRLRARARAGQCVRCGYDLRGSPGRCPECGTDVTAEAMATARPSSG